jgi:aldose 1-epimerase
LLQAEHVDKAFCDLNGWIGIKGSPVSILAWFTHWFSLIYSLNKTKYSYFNLSDPSSIKDTQVTLSTNLHLPVSEDLVPLGTVLPYPDVEADKTFVLGAEEPDIDRCFIHKDDPEQIPIDTRGRELKLCAAFYHPHSRIHLEVLSTEPAYQFYTGKYIDVPEISLPGGTGVLPARVPRSAFCVEPGRYLNAVNVDSWRGMVTLKKGEKYGAKIVYRAWQGSETSS